MKNKLLILAPIKGKPTKVLNSKLEKKKSYVSGKYFTLFEAEYDNFHKFLKKEILNRKDIFITLGELTAHGRQLMDEGTAAPRRKKGANPTIQDSNSNQIVLDLDDHVMKGFDALDPEPAIKQWLKKRKINCDVTWQITSSQQLKTELARIRLYFLTDDNHSLLERKSWAQSEKIGADGSVFTCSQPIYTAPPKIKGGIDPIKNRNGFIKGKTRTFSLPEQTQKEIIKSSANGFGGSEYDFDADLPASVLSGSVHRRYFMPLAFHLANKGISRDQCFLIVSGLSMQCKNREFDPENVWDYINQAYEKITEEKSEVKVVTSETIKDKKEEVENIPVFPVDLIKSWPEPWPMIWENFSRLPRDLEPALLIPTVLASCIFHLNNAYIYEGQNRRPNLLFLNLAPSTAGKDVNSLDVLRSADEIFKEATRGGEGSTKIPYSPFADMLKGNISISADTSFVESFDEKQRLFWILTEATDLFKQFGGRNVSSVAAIVSKMIEASDGHQISGKAKSGKKIQTVDDPCCPIVLYAQPKTIKEYITLELVEKGLVGRACISVIPKIEKEDTDMFRKVKTEGKAISLDKDFIEFFSKKTFADFAGKKRILGMSEKENSEGKSDKDKMNEWERKKVRAIRKESEINEIVCSRIGNATEQLYTVVAGVCRHWDIAKGKKAKKTRTHIDPTILIPLLEYWIDTKLYTIQNLVSSESDFLLAEFVSMLKKAIAGNMPSLTNATNLDLEMYKTSSAIRKSYLFRNLKNLASVKNYYEKNPNKSFTRDFDSMLLSLLRNEIIIENESGRATFVSLLEG